jgi:hypothetical protein
MSELADSHYVGRRKSETDCGYSTDAFLVSNFRFCPSDRNREKRLPRCVGLPRPELGQQLIDFRLHTALLTSLLRNHPMDEGEKMR